MTDVAQKEAIRNALADVLAQARALGADAADASLSEREGLSVEVRLGALEGVEREEGRSLALRALIGRRQAAAVSTDLSAEGRKLLAERVVSMARAAPEDPYCGLLDPDRRATEFHDLDLDDDPRPNAEALERLAQEAEAAALSVPGVANSGGSGASWEAGAAAYATSDGFFGFSHGVSYGLGLSVIAERDGLKERDYEGRSLRKLARLPDPATLGRIAGERAAARLGSRKIDSRRAPIVFESRVASRVLSPLIGAISGPAIARGTSFLKDKLHQPVFAPGIVLEEDPLRLQGLASRAFDGEGAATAKKRIIDDGVLTGWLMNAASARQLGLATTGNAGFGHGGPPGISTFNLTLVPGPQASLDALLADVGEGLLVTEMFSPALNGNTGDWSVGVAGFWFENGARAYPVSEVTVAGNLRDIFSRLVPGGDFERRSSFDSPSLFVDDLAIAGR